MLTPEQYLGEVAERVQRAGGRLSTVQLGPVTAVVGLFTEPAPLPATNHCVIVAAVPEVSAAALADFTARARQHARANLTGWTTASIVLAGLVGQRVHPDAALAASAKPGHRFGGETRMVAVDLSTGQLSTFGGDTVVRGSVNAKLTYCFPPPNEAGRPRVPPPPYAGPVGPRPPVRPPPGLAPQRSPYGG
ncbi:hypothetical protein AB0F15_27270 [Amycolatopsis sp. NPDC026612]|uniref:hypothetical protein n=1 Tax=Amycolatopsis sp. NPDC026612 TaxID=3155466 RepID=UPI0033C36C6F